MGGLRVFLLVARSVYCISYYFWQFLIMAVGLILAEEPGTFIYDWQSAGPPGGSVHFLEFLEHLKFVQALFTVYLLHELKVPGSQSPKSF